MSIDTPEELAAMRAAGKVVADAMEAMRRSVRPGVTTAELDAIAELNGFYADACISVPVGKARKETMRLVGAAQAALADGMKAARAGAPLNAIGTAVDVTVTAHAASVCRELIGHGIGRR